MPKFQVGDIVSREGHNDQEIILVGVDAYFTKNFYYQDKYNNYIINFNDEDNWSIKKKEVTIDSDIFDRAWDIAFKENTHVRVNVIIKSIFKKELGL